MIKKKRERMKKRGRDGDAFNGMREQEKKNAHVDERRKKIVVEGSAWRRHLGGLLIKDGIANH